jgi:hypothetical protein
LANAPSRPRPDSRECFRESEVENLDDAVGRHLDVGRLQIAMDHARVVRGFERRADLDGQRQHLGNWNRPVRDAVGERLSLDELQDERDRTGAALGASTGRLFEAMDGADVRVMERREDLGFTLEPRQPIGIARNVGWQRLERHFPTESGVARPPHLAHAPFSQGSEDLIHAESSAWRKCHG